MPEQPVDALRRGGILPPAEQDNVATHKRDPQVFIDTELPALRSKVEAYQTKGWRFVNLNGSTVPDGVELIYSFSDQEAIENLRLVVGSTDEVPAISDIYFNSFVFENETHDLYGVNIKGIAIDFGGKFYQTSVPTPFNPASTQANIHLIERNATDVAAEPSSSGRQDDTTPPTTPEQEV